MIDVDDKFVEWMKRQQAIKLEQDREREEVNATPSNNLQEVAHLRDFHLRSEEENKDKRYAFKVHKTLLDEKDEIAHEKEKAKLEYLDKSLLDGKVQDDLDGKGQESEDELSNFEAEAKKKKKSKKNNEIVLEDFFKKSRNQRDRLKAPPKPRVALNELQTNQDGEDAGQKDIRKPHLKGFD
jgi:hypothetical protein